MRHICIAILLLGLGFCSMSNADEITFRNGKTMSGRVTEYKAGKITIKKSDGALVKGDIDKIDSIVFDDSTDAEESAEEKKVELPPAIRRQIEMEIANVEGKIKEDQSAVLLYIDTEKSTDTLPQEFVEYKCYTGGGYSGVVRAPFRKVWTRTEPIYGNGDGTRTIKLDPGPPYEDVEIKAVLVPGEVCNLGRIVLKKVRAEGTASIHGVVKDIDGNPVPEAIVTYGKGQTKTNAKGEYKIDGFGLEVVSLEARKLGHFGLKSQVRIRNMDERSILQDLRIFRPMRVKISYVISSPGSDSFQGPGVQEGTIDVVVNNTMVDLTKFPHASNSFTTFVKESRLRLSLYSGELQLSHGMGPVYHQSLPRETDFDAVLDTGIGNQNNQTPPPLKKGLIAIVRGFPKNDGYAVSRYCVKYIVEDIQTD